MAVFGIYLVGWFAYLFSASSSGQIPEEVLIQAIDSLTFAMGGFLIYVTVRYGKTSTNSYMNAICTLAIVLAVMGLIRYFHGDGQAVATLGNTNFLAAFLAISVPCFFRKKWWMLLPLIIGTLFIAHTSTAIVAVLIGTGFYLWGWKGAALSLIPGIAYFALFKAPLSLLERISFWTDGLQKLSHSCNTMLFGVGPGIYWQAGNMLHSAYAYLFWNFGIFGLWLALFYILRSFLNISVDRRIFASFLIVLADGVGNHLFHTAPTAMLAITIFALNDRTLPSEV
jgi:hypothetical protein